MKNKNTPPDKPEKSGLYITSWLNGDAKDQFLAHAAAHPELTPSVTIREALDYYLACGGHSEYRRWWLTREIEKINRGQ